MALHLLEHISIKGDENCLYLTFSYYLYGTEDSLKILRKQILNQQK